MDFSSIDQQSADHFQGKEDKEEEKEHKDDKLVINNNNTLKESAEPRLVEIIYSYSIRIYQISQIDLCK